jgi:hydrogenase-4 component B
VRPFSRTGAPARLAAGICPEQAEADAGGRDRRLCVDFIICSLALFLGGGVCALLAGRGKTACLIGSASAVLASGIGLFPAAQVLIAAFHSSPAPVHADFGALPVGRILMQLDALSAFFLVPALLLSALCAVSGAGYFLRPAHGGHHHSGAQWFFYNLLAGGMVLMLTSADAFLFLLAWEIMSLAPVFLISLHDEEEHVRSAAWIYLVATHLGALCLLAFFALAGERSGGDLSFASLAVSGGAEGAGPLFLLALLGFGTKAGLMPLHVWLPEAHPAAPSHISAFLSGAMIKAGIYGLFRALTFIGPPQAWWAYLLIGLGAFSALSGILLALVQHNIKRSLAYSSVENMGIIHMAAGFGLFAIVSGNPGLGLIFFTGAFLHLLNHCLAKSLLFLCAGAMLNSAGTVSLRALGGLQKRLPVVGCCFALGAAAISALPPLNGFAGEFLLYLSLSLGGAQGTFAGLIYWIGLVALALTGGFTLLCFARLYGLAFLGEARSPEARSAAPAPLLERIPLFCLCLLCLLSAAAAPVLAEGIRAALAPLLAPLLGTGPAESALAARVSRESASLLWSVNSAFFGLLLFLGLIILLRRALPHTSPPASPATWDCGYAKPDERMQYSGASFSQPAALFMTSLIRGETRIQELREYFPSSIKILVRYPDHIQERWFRPLFLICLGIANWSKHLQHGRVNGYILYMLLFLVALLAWKVGRL